jgi:hypothetical protein
MSQYLHRLLALKAGKRLPEQPSKPSKPPFEGFGGSRGKHISPKFEPSRLQREADSKNVQAQREGVTDRWCACGLRATFAWRDVHGRETWRCLECGPVKGEA